MLFRSTGASSGIGAALTKLFANDGHRLLVCARNSDGLAKATHGLPSTSYFECDVSSEANVVNFFDWVKERTSSVDVLVPCAAVMGPIGSILDVDADKWLEALKIDLFGTMLTIKHAVPLMKAERRPRILMLSGGGAFDPMPNLSAYGISKAGTIRLAETLAIELAPRNIAVNVFAPGFVATGIFDTMLAAGPERGGHLYKVIVDLLDGWRDTDIQRPLELARFLISDRAAQAKAWQDLNTEAAGLGLVIPTRFGLEQRLVGSKVENAYIWGPYGSWPYADRKSTRLNSSHT